MTSRKALFVLIALMCIWCFTLLPILSNQEASLLKNPFKKKVLDNGLTLIYQKDTSSAITVLQILIKGGKGAEPEGKEGLAYLTTRLALEIPDQKKVQDMMSQASRTYSIGQADYSLVNIMSLSENLEKTLKITTKIMLKPLFSGMRIDIIKKQMNYQRKRQEDDPIQVGYYALLEKLFANTSYGGSVLGSEKSLKAIKKKNIKNFYENYFTAKNMIVAVISDLKEEVLSEILYKYFSKFPTSEPPESRQNAVSIPEEKNIFIERDTKQFFISLAFPLPQITSKNFTLAYMLENLLGKGVNSRLWPLRSKEKLAYNVNSRATQMKDGGILEAYLETDKEKKDVALEALKKVLNELYENGITEEELEVTKTNSKAYFLRANETKDKRTSSLASFEAYGLGCEFLSRFFSEIDAISLEEINVYIKDILNPKKVVEVVVGPKEAPEED